MQQENYDVRSEHNACLLPEKKRRAEISVQLQNQTFARQQTNLMIVRAVVSSCGRPLLCVALLLYDQHHPNRANKKKNIISATSLQSLR